MRPINGTWTPDREGLLRVLWTQGLSAGQIAKRLGGGITRNAVIGKRIRLGLPNRDMPNRSYGKQNPKSREAIKRAMSRAMPPKLKPEPVRKPRTPEKGPNAVAWLDHKPGQCEMFCAGEEGAQGFVCGAPVEPGKHWCAACYRIAYPPSMQTRRRAA